jgi:hypothetical protein
MIGSPAALAGMILAELAVWSWFHFTRNAER